MADIRNLKAYIAKDSPYYARRFTERVIAVFVKIVVTFFTQPMLYCRVPRVNRRHAQD